MAKMFKYDQQAIPASRRALSNTLGTHSRCASYIRATHKEYVLPSFSLSQMPETDVSYETLKKLLATRTSVVIVVREPWELREYGNIPRSINVPLGPVNIALQLNPEEFKEKYGGDMPQPTDLIVFSCLAGIRSQKALDQAVSLEYKDVQLYAGGWQDWAKCEQES
ncbi:thiosulfate sulfurtransferase/rhodanese-like domain-containing protein 3 [Salvelinus fontinalis]|uniref:thiosulfate sulfurtransferase/rhodanese-like domain-containing protein 3 n=1 Tax=Salvelinus fontinalis TaxID=8038 RepID=UPI002484F778|nr:thiosulfate sulfurtransferase/rhodanese-like domain-containing protein 3 [Salvelinus fontinalis]